eukprot:scaffold133346_cov72-Phaeocystis_antarctica.AAC.2
MQEEKVQEVLGCEEAEMQEDLRRVRRAVAVAAALAAAPAFAAGVRRQRHLRPWLVLVQAEHAICNGLGQ